MSQLSIALHPVILLGRPLYQAGQLKFRRIVVLPDELRGEIDLAILNAYQREMEKSNGKPAQ